MKRIRKVLFYAFAVVWLATLLWHTHKPMPEGTNVNGASIGISQDSIRFLSDVTARDAWGRRIVDQQIFDAVFSLIDGAEKFIVLDFFLFNDDKGSDNDPGLRPLSRELADRLISRKLARPQLQVIFITDPINDVYGGRPSPLLAELRRASIDVLVTDLDELRDSNAGYSAIWRIAFQWFGNSPSGGWLPDPFRDQGDVSFRTWLTLANLKANHRKAIVADTANGTIAGIVTSANPHDASSLHSNVAWAFEGALALQVLDSELKIARLSGWRGEFHMPSMQLRNERAVMDAAYVTEGAIQIRILDAIHATAAKDAIDIAMFYLSEREIIDALKDAARRGVAIRLILDPNKDAFGIEKDGVPNRSVANELVDSGITDVRWYRTQGEQFHTKLVLVKHGKQLFASLGSANLTRRNIGNYNLEANIDVSMSVDSALAHQLGTYFDRLWNNDEQKHIEYTAPFGTFKDDSTLTYLRYRFMELTGLSTF